jgi:2-C-methyl-D-erythritol 2,4-cyclodiphosphate synthase
MRIGIGYDIHALVNDRDLILGGVTIPFQKGLLGHSDADVLIHAICDALLGAAGKGDIGTHFPDNDPKYKDISSLKLLSTTMDIIHRTHYDIVNIDCTVFAQAPKLSPYRESMETIIARTIDLDPNRINIKATTTEKLGVIGEGRGIAAMCVALIESIGVQPSISAQSQP